MVVEATPNPEPPEIKDVFLSFSPPNPQVGDTVTIQVVDEDNIPVEGLSVTGKRDSWTIFSMVTSDAGQADFIVQEGTIEVLVSGGNYNPAAITIVVTSEGVTTEDGGTLPTEDNPIGSDNQTLDNTNEDNNDENNNDEDTGTGSGLSSALGEYQNIFIIIIAVLVVVILGLLTVMKLRGRDGDEWQDDGAAWDDNQDIVNAPLSYDSVPAAAPPSDGRPPNCSQPLINKKRLPKSIQSAAKYIIFFILLSFYSPHPKFHYSNPFQLTARNIEYSNQQNNRLDFLLYTH